MTIQRIVSGAHYGLRDWLAQRITGLIMALYTIFLLFIDQPHTSSEVWGWLFIGYP